jgi:hypothetical protein
MEPPPLIQHLKSRENPYAQAIWYLFEMFPFLKRGIQIRGMFSFFCNHRGNDHRDCPWMLKTGFGQGGKRQHGR